MNWTGGLPPRLGVRLLAEMRHALAADDCPLDPGTDCLNFVRLYAPTIDGKPLNFDAYKHLRGLYRDTSQDLTIMAGAQTGKTVRLIVQLLRDSLIHWGGALGYYFPDLVLAGGFSRERIKPLIRSVPEWRSLLGKETKTREGTDNVLTRSFGETVLYFLSVKGRSMTEGTPMQAVYFDEVRKMAPGDMQRARERTSAQRSPSQVMVSTANYPDSDIHAAFMAGDQRYWHTRCACPDGVILSKTWPDCVVDMTSAGPRFRRYVAGLYMRAGLPYCGLADDERARWGAAVYRCPTCGTVILDPRDGEWRAHNPGSYAHSYQMPQLLTPTFSAARALAKWSDPEADRQELWNSLVGLPWISPEARPVTLSDLKGCVDPDLRWAMNEPRAWRREHATFCSMGIDVQAGYNAVVVKQRGPGGKYRTVHVEIVHGAAPEYDPWRRCGQLMQDLDVRVCVVDGQPDWNAARRFCQAFRGRAWVAYFVVTETAPMIDWKDRRKAPPGQRGEEAFKWQVNIQKFKGFQWSCGRWGKGHNATPDPTGLVQSLPRGSGGQVLLTSGLSKGRTTPTPICRDLYWQHQQRIVLEKSYGTNPENIRRGKYTMVATYTGADPHLADANLYADVALSRVTRPTGLEY